LSLPLEAIIQELLQYIGGNMNHRGLSLENAGVRINPCQFKI